MPTTLGLGGGTVTGPVRPTGRTSRERARVALAHRQQRKLPHRISRPTAPLSYVPGNGSNAQRELLQHATRAQRWQPWSDARLF